MALEELTLRYIKRCDEILEARDVKEADKFQDIIISTFGDYIAGIKNELDNYSGISLYGSRQVDFLGDIEKLKGKLEIFLATGCRPTKGIKNSIDGNGGINIHNNNQNSNTNTNTTNIEAEIKLLFDEAKAKVESDENLSETEIKEVLEKIKEIEDIHESGETKNKKWFKLKPTMEWLGTKGLNTATTILNLITAIIKYNS